MSLCRQYMMMKKKQNQITFRQHTKRDLSIQLFYVYKDDNLHDD